MWLTVPPAAASAYGRAGICANIGIRCASVGIRPGVEITLLDAEILAAYVRSDPDCAGSLAGEVRTGPDRSSLPTTGKLSATRSVFSEFPAADTFAKLAPAAVPAIIAPSD
jgi:hypothetical protein